MAHSILLVDDEVAFLHPMQRMLAGPALAVDTAETFEGAMTLLHTKQYDAVIADIRLGGVLSREGLRILNHVKTWCRGTKVIIMTGHSAAGVEQEASRLKADHYCEKPVSFQALSDVLTRLGVMNHDHVR
jgi:DNA-binding NtrC family response regulator